MGNNVAPNIGAVPLLIVGFRVINSLCIKTYFNPDEYWQCLEIAHFDVFDYGYKTWEWNKEWAVRSYTYPSIISFMYYIFKILHIDTTTFLVTFNMIFVI